MSYKLESRGNLNLRFYQSKSSVPEHLTLQPESPVPPDELEQTLLVPLQPSETTSNSGKVVRACKLSTLSMCCSPYPLLPIQLLVISALDAATRIATTA